MQFKSLIYCLLMVPLYYMNCLDDLSKLGRMCFKACLGLRINKEKSRLIIVKRVDNLNELTLELGCQLCSAVPSSYMVCSEGKI